MDSLLQDFRYGVRTLLKSPGFALAAVLVLGLGIGAATAIFSVVDGVILRPLPYPEPDRLVMLWETNGEKGLEHEPISPVNFLDYRQLNHVFEDAAAWWRPDVNLSDESHEPIRVNTIEVSSNFFTVLGVQPAIGRGFPGQALHASASEIVIGHRLWQTHFQSDPNLVGRGIRLNGGLFTVVGVMPAGFSFPGETDIWQRLGWDLSQHSRSAHFMEAVGRLKPGVDAANANIELGALTRRLGSSFASTNGGWGARAVPLHTEILGFFRPALFALLGAVGVLLLIACINVASLLLARSTAREREVAVRAATGASRSRLIRQFLTESLTLGLAGAALGVLFAYAGVKGLVAFIANDVPRLDQVSINGTVLIFATIMAVATALIFGLVPALFASRTNLTQSLKEGGRSFSASAAGRRARSALVVAEVALAVMLLVGAGLLVRSFARLIDEHTGVQASGVITANLQLSDRRDSDEDWTSVGTFYARLLEAIRADPAVLSAGAGNILPLDPGWRLPFLVAGMPAPKAGEESMAQYHTVDEGFFRTLGVPVIAGRAFDERDTPEAPGVIIVNDVLARRYFPNESPIGKVIFSRAQVIGPLGRRLVKDEAHQIVGVVGNVKNSSLRSAAEPAIYHPLRQFPFRNMNLVVRARTDSNTLPDVIRRAVQRLDPTLPVSRLRAMDAVLGDAVDQPRLLMFLMAGFAALALILAALGIYGVLAFNVGQRRQEISIRMALGAQAGNVLRLIVAQGLALAGVGAAIGLLAALALGRAMSSLLYGVTSTDLTTFAAAMTMVLIVAALACFFPARRAAHFDPLEGLRGN